MPTISSNTTTAVSWGAIFAGAAAAAALSFILMLLGFGFGLISVSPWSGEGASAATIGVGSIVWLIIIHLAAAGLGGYLAGRLRVKWPDTHHDEVYFRDTAHGLVTWSVATIVAITFMGGSASAVMSGGLKAGSEAVGAIVPSIESMRDEQGYFAQRLLRNENEPDAAIDESRVEEVTTILWRALRDGEMDDADQSYLAALISDQSDLSQSQAEQRVEDLIGQAQSAYEQAIEAVDEAREAAAWTAIWLFIALLAGAFFAAFCATIGGRQRDAVLTVID